LTGANPTVSFRFKDLSVVVPLSIDMDANFFWSGQLLDARFFYKNLKLIEKVKKLIFQFSHLFLFSASAEEDII
jgi:hypothetical protein